MKHFTFILLGFLFFSATSFRSSEKITFSFCKAIKEDQMTLQDFQKISSFTLNQNDWQFVSCDFFVIPNNGHDSFEFAVKSVNAKDVTNYKTNISKITAGSKVYLDDIYAINPAGSKVMLHAVAFVIK